MMTGREYIAKVQRLKNAWRDGQITTEQWFDMRDKLRNHYAESMHN